MSKESDIHHLLPNGGDDSDDDLELSAQRTKESLTRPILKSFCILVILSIVSTASFWAGTRAAIRRSKLDAQCAAHTTQWSPVLRDVSIHYETQHFNGSFMKQNIYRQPASPDVDHAWEDLGVDYRAGIISYKDGLASGLAPSFVQRAARYGGGFLVNVEGMHHLHCLNLLRKSLYFNYEYYKKLGKHEFLNDEAILQPHITHCLDAVRQVLMCNVDTGVLGQVWAENDGPVAFPDFHTKHRCKNYEDVKEWARKLQRPPNDEIPRDYLAKPRPGDVLAMVP